MLSDNEIVKAMICCTNFPVCDRDNCPYGESTNCATMLGKDVVDLINSQKAEIDDLKRNDLPRCKAALRRANEIGMALEKENQELKAEIDRLKKYELLLFVMLRNSMFLNVRRATAKQCNIAAIRTMRMGLKEVEFETAEKIYNAAKEAVDNAE